MFCWQDREDCRCYDEDREISLAEVHYGWLAPGENNLTLLADVPMGARVLDVGCGMGENVAALHSMSFDTYGIDISPHMLDRAQTKLKQSHAMPSTEVPERLLEADVLDVQRAFRGRFNLVLSVYSLEFMPDIDAFRQAVANIADVLEDDGQFVLCVSHPTGHPHYPNIINNETTDLAASDAPLLLYSIRDLVQAICDAEMVPDRVVEQQTMNPSQISYQESLEYPYHFKEGRNPFKCQFDYISNKYPHTLIVKSRKATPHS
ncbi:MAG: class I SAM-dependent methyltransferase [Kiritimatiellales bacterium]|nr:class I SAM-dependent methyltransferase [Kiritimatiellales bacterium]